MDSFSYLSFDKLVEDCCRFYDSSLKGDLDFSAKRAGLADWVRKFHGDCGTLSPAVEEATKLLQEDPCVLLMTAHQPNLFAYGGVLRKATLVHALAKRLAKQLATPVVCFFGLADQDLSDDRWVRCAVLPDVERRGGVLELHSALPEKMLLCKVEKPSKKVLEGWRNEVEGWLKRNMGLVERKNKGQELGSANVAMSENLNEFWKLVEQAYAKAENYPDFTGFIMSKIVNEVWGYPTLFARFSECQQNFGPEFETLLSRFDNYSGFVKEAVSSTECSGSGVREDEFLTVPFWLHCDCGGKARLTAEREGDSLFGIGKCLKCEKEYHVGLGSWEKAHVSEVLGRVSARSIAMPLVFFKSLGVCCYVGGEGGREYLLQAKHVAEKMFGSFPVTVVWRPYDVYFGVGQAAALATFEELSGNQDFAEYEAVLQSIKAKVADVQRKVDELEAQKKRLLEDASLKSEDRVEKLKTLSNLQANVRKQVDYPVLVRHLGLLENVGVALGLHPCIVDYAVNVGLKATSEGWIRFLEEDGSLRKDVHLATCLEEVLECPRRNLRGELA